MTSQEDDPYKPFFEWNIEGFTKFLTMISVLIGVYVFIFSEWEKIAEKDALEKAEWRQAVVYGLLREAGVCGIGYNELLVGLKEAARLEPKIFFNPSDYDDKALNRMLYELHSRGVAVSIKTNQFALNTYVGTSVDCA